MKVRALLFVVFLSLFALTTQAGNTQSLTPETDRDVAEPDRGPMILETDVPAFLPLGPMPFIRQEMLHRAEQVGSEPPPFAVRGGEPGRLDEPGEEGLCEILRVCLGMSAARHEGIKRVPVNPAEFTERIPGCLKAFPECIITARLIPHQAVLVSQQSG